MTADRHPPNRPLAGVRIVDFTRVLSGPYCTALMADLGADVIKIEPPTGDDYRHIGPFRDDESLLFQTINSGKRSIALDLKSPDDLQTARDLIKQADILVENFRPGVMAKFGLGADTILAQHPRLIYVSISGFGQTGPNAHKPAYDVVVQAMSGLMAMTGEPDGAPTMIGEAFADVAGSVFGAYGAMVALFNRTRTGQGCHIDLAMFDSLIAMMPIISCRTLLGETPPQRTGNRHALSAPFGIYQAGDGYFAVAVLNDRLFEKFAAAIEYPEIATDPRFSSDANRRANEPALADIIEGWAKQYHAKDVVSRLADGGIPAAEIQTPSQAWSSDHARQRAMASDVAHPTLGTLSIPEQPLHFSHMPRGGRSPAPNLNGDGDEIRNWLAEEASK